MNNDETGVAAGSPEVGGDPQASPAEPDADTWRHVLPSLISAGDPGELLERGCRHLVEDFGLSRCIAATISDDGSELVGRAAYDPTDILPVTRALTSLYTTPLEARKDGKWEASAWCVVEDEQVYIPDVSRYSFRTERTYARSFLVKAFGVTELLLTPIRGSESVLGLLGADKKGQDGSISEGERVSVQTLATLMGTMLERLEEEPEQAPANHRGQASEPATGKVPQGGDHQHLMQRVLEAMNEGLVLIDPEGRVRFLNAEVASLLNVFPWDVVGTDWRQVLPLSRSEAFATLLDDPPEVLPPHLRRWRLELPDGGVTHVGLTVLPLEGAGYRGWRTILLEDVSSDVDVERMREEFISMLIHDLKAPAQSTVGFAELLRMERVGELNEAQHEFVRRIEDSGETMLALVDDILQVEQFEAGRTLLERERLELAPVAQEVLDRLELAARQRGVELRNDVPSDLPPVFGDRLRLVQVLQNLVDNAIEASTEADVVCVRAAEASVDGGPGVRIEVEDEGEGIDDETARRMFDKLWTGRLDNGAGHMGLGLVIARLIVEGHGGEIRAEGEPGQGTTIAFTVPAYEADR